MQPDETSRHSYPTGHLGVQPPAYPVSPPPQYGPQEYPARQFPPAKKKGLGTGGITAIVLAAVVAVVLVIVGILAVRGAGKPSVTVGMDQPATDGGLELTVTSASCNNARVGSSTLGKVAQGQFCLVSVSVKNVSDGSKSFSAGNQHARDQWGTKYDTDSGAEVYANLDSKGALFDDINPGNSVRGVLVFDMPDTARVATVELHGSRFSGGIAVTVPS